jgi:hypothetical protein
MYISINSKRIICDLEKHRIPGQFRQANQTIYWAWVGNGSRWDSFLCNSQLLIFIGDKLIIDDLL